MANLITEFPELFTDVPKKTNANYTTMMYMWEMQGLVNSTHTG